MMCWSRLAVMMVVGLGCASAYAEGMSLAPVEQRGSVSDFELKDISGAGVRLSDFRGKAVVVSFWATWCEPCKQELAFLNRYYEELKEQGFEVIAVATDAPETQSRVRTVARQKDWTIKVVLDTAGSVSALLNPRGATPYSIFIDRAGRMVYDHEGYTVGDETGYRVMIEALLAEKAADGGADSSGWLPAGSSVSVTDTLVLEARGDNGDDTVDDDYFLGVNRLNVTGTAGDFSLWTRVDAWKFESPPAVEIQGENPFQDHLSLERFQLRYQGEKLEVVAGDYFLQLGRGIALAVRKGDEVSVETALRGGRLVWAGESFKAGTFGGKVANSNLDPIRSHFIEELEDVLGGGFMEFSGVGGMTLGAHGVHRVYGTSLLPEDSDWSQTGGAYVDLSGVVDWMTLYGEVDVQRRYQVGDFQNGLAGFVAANVEMGDTTLLVEGMRMDDFDLGVENFPAPLNRPPTLSRIRDEVITMSDYYGAQVRLEHRIKAVDIMLFTNGRYRLNLPGSDSPIVEYHGYGGMEWGFNQGRSHLNASAGYRSDRFEGGDEVRTLVHYYVDYVQAVGARYALHVISDTEYKGYVTASGELDHYWFGSTYVGVDRSGLGGITFELGYDTKNVENTAVESPSLFLAGILKWHITDKMELRAIGGTQHGGLKCVNGVCREYPSFAGLKTEWIGRF
ncbi:MAG: TlpA disulfide reductase family protein [Myxococcota bacterium]|nr:TlpA disulfide reductase family protein [Myxococcota bacterium]